MKLPLHDDDPRIDFGDLLNGSNGTPRRSSLILVMLNTSSGRSLVWTKSKFYSSNSITTAIALVLVPPMWQTDGAAPDQWMTSLANPEAALLDQ